MSNITITQDDKQDPEKEMVEMDSVTKNQQIIQEQAQEIERLRNELKELRELNRALSDLHKSRY